MEATSKYPSIIMESYISLYNCQGTAWFENIFSIFLFPVFTFIDNNHFISYFQICIGISDNNEKVFLLFSV